MTDSPKKNIQAFDPTLRFIERSGQFVLTCTIILFAAIGAIWPEPYADVWKLVLAHLVGGRPGNVIWGIKLGFHPLFIYFQCYLQDIIILLLFYPPLVAGYRRAIEWRVLGPALLTIREQADRHKSKIEPYGVAGLMIFVIFPFWSTGALVGAVVGYLLGMRVGVTFGAVLAGNFIAAGIWVFLFDKMSQISGHLTTGLLIAIFGGVIAGALITQMRRLIKTRRKASRAQPTDEENESGE